MTRLEPALLLSVLPHGESGAVIRVLTAASGVTAIYVPGARSRTLRPVLQIGNCLALDVKSGRSTQLPLGRPHLVAANLAMVHGQAAMAVVAHVAVLLAHLLPESVPQPRLFAMAEAVMAGAGANVDHVTLAAALVRLELALLSELGVGLDLARCAATGDRHDLAFVSPRSRQAVNRSAGQPWADRLLPLPAFLTEAATPTTDAVADGLALTGYFLKRDVLADHPARARLQAARAEMVARLTAASPK